MQRWPAPGERLRADIAIPAAGNIRLGMKACACGWSDCYLRSFFPGLFLIWLLGCATAPKIDWNSRIGNYNYDQAVLEMGPADRSAALTDGTKVVEWLTARGRIY